MHTLQTLSRRQRIIQVLELLQKQPMHAYLLRQEVSMSKSTLYSFLKELTGTGYVKVHKELSDNSPTKQVYSLTVSGELFLAKEKLAYTLDLAAALAWCKQTYTSLSQLRNQLLAK